MKDHAIDPVSRYAIEVEDGMPVEPAANAGAAAINLPVFHAAASGKGYVRLLKTVLTSACENNCVYCAFRLGRDVTRTTYHPHELAEQFMCLWRAGLLDGLFLSSGICGGGVKTQDRLLVTAEILRTRWAYFGYLHLKIMPGCEFDQVYRAMQLADRVSINLEAPLDRVLHQLAPQKPTVDELRKRLEWVDTIRRTMDSAEGWKGRWPSSATQFVVGAGGETDLELLQLGQQLHRQSHLKRVYFSRFAPVIDTPLEGNSPEHQDRVLRLYQSDFLLRDYGFQVNELPIQEDGSLNLEHDPKKWWAEQHYRMEPLEITSAEYWQLIRLPGVGPKTASKILEYQATLKIRDSGALRQVGVNMEKVHPYILINGRQPEHNPSLFGCTMDSYAPFY